MQRTADRVQFLADIIVTAVEGGTGYWASVSDYHWSDEHPSLTRATLRDQEECADKPHLVTIDTVARGISKVLEDGFSIRADLRQDIAEANRDSDGGMIDAEGADIIVQAALFGEIIYG